MKLAYLSSSVLPSRNANSVHVMKMCRAFAIEGAEVTLYAPRRTPATIAEIFSHFGIEKNLFQIALIPSLPLYKFRIISYIVNAMLSLKREAPQIIYGRDLRSVFISSLIIPKAKVFYESHRPYSSYNLVDKIFIRMLISRPNFINFVVISESLRRIYLKELGLQAADFIALHDGADAPASLEIECRLNNADRLRVGYAGHLYEGRGIEMIIHLAERFPHFEFVVAGGKEEDIAKWKVSASLDNLQFKGYLLPAQVASFLTDCDILLAPYQNIVSVDGKGDTSEYMSPLKIFEYMASGRPMIVSDLPVLHEVLSEDDVCFAAPNDIDSWAEKINFLKSPVHRKRMAAKALNKLVNNYTWSVRAKRVLRDV